MGLCVRARACVELVRARARVRARRMRLVQLEVVKQAQAVMLSASLMPFAAMVQARARGAGRALQ